MKSQARLQIHDNHFHCRPDGWKGVGAVREFMAAGGTSIAHVRLPTYPPDVDAFEASCNDHLAFGARIKTETGCVVHAAVGPYPLEIMKVAEVKGWPAAIEFGRACYDVAARFCEQQKAVCIGEVGRAHFPVPAETQTNLSELIVYGMGTARDADVPIMLHTEHAEPATMAEFAAMADKAGLPRERVIKHYAGPLVLPEENHGLVPSVICGRSNLRDALRKSKGKARFLMETDYVDEPTRPNVVMPCDTVPKRVNGLLQNGDMTEEQVQVMAELVGRLYG
jgi:TatD-related deoxyribonuclease